MGPFTICTDCDMMMEWDDDEAEFKCPICGMYDFEMENEEEG